MSDIINDGSLSYGSRQLTINGTAYATDDFRYDTDKTEIIRTDHLERPSGQVIIKGRTTGSATLQLATTSTPLPGYGQSFTETEGTFYVTKVGSVEGKGAERKIPIEFILPIGSVTVT